MAAARDQAARVLRTEPDSTESDAARETSAAIAESIRAQLSDDAPSRRAAELPERPTVTKPAAPAVSASPAAARSGKRKFVLMGVAALLALAAASYGVYWVVVGRFHVSTDDAYVRANNTMLGARVSGHIAAIFPRDNSIVHTGEAVFKIDDGDYRIAVDAARSRIETQQATIDRIGRQITAQESAVEQAKAQLASAEAVGVDLDGHRLAGTDPLQLRLLVVRIDIDLIERHHIAEPLPDHDEIAGVHQAIGEGAVDRGAHRSEVKIALGLGKRGLQFRQLSAGFCLLRPGHLDIVARSLVGGACRSHPRHALIATRFRKFEGSARSNALRA